jgi:hypothetical protein
MKENKTKLLVLILFIGSLFIVQESGAQHLLEYGGSKEVIKIVAEHGGSLYYQIWPDTTELDTRAILMSDITSLKAISYVEVDSIIASIVNAKVAAAKDIEVEQNKTIRQFFIPIVASSFRIDQINYSLSAMYGVLYNGVNLYGGGVGYGRVNKGQSFIVLNSVQMQLFYNRYFKRPSLRKSYYCGGEFTVGKTLSGKYNNAWSTNDISEEIKLEKDDLRFSIGFNVHAGLDLKDRFLIEIGLLYRDLGITFPDDTKKYVLAELKLGYKI